MAGLVELAKASGDLRAPVATPAAPGPDREQVERAMRDRAARHGLV